MTSNDRILAFLDGALSPEDEAEFLHRLSVSPERRQLLRSFINQQSMFARDRMSIQVPYQAEQKLWQRIAMISPAASPAVSSIPTAAVQTAATVSTKSRLAAPLYSAVATIALFIGLTCGYFLGAGNRGETPVPQRATASQSFPSSETLPAEEPASKTYRSYGTYANSPASDLVAGESLDNAAVADDVQFADLALADVPLIVETSPVSAQTVVPPTSGTLRVGEPINRPAIGGVETKAPVTRTLLERFEFAFVESFGRQFPNSEATNVSLPLVTNSAVSILFQILPDNSSLWAGVSGGTANLTRKHLFSRRGNPVDPLQEVMTGEYVHVQSNWLGLMAQYRLPVFSKANLTFGAGMGLASAGTLGIVETGIRYEATKEVGFTAGLRGVQLSYDLSEERDRVVSESRGSLVIPRGVQEAPNSYNIELNTGLYFHF